MCCSYKKGELTIRSWEFKGQRTFLKPSKKGFFSHLRVSKKEREGDIFSALVTSFRLIEPQKLSVNHLRLIIIFDVRTCSVIK